MQSRNGDKAYRRLTFSEGQGLQGRFKGLSDLRGFVTSRPERLTNAWHLGRDLNIPNTFQPIV